MKTRIASWATAAALTVSAVVATAAPASADPVPGSSTQFYAACWVNLLGSPWYCVRLDEAHSTHICQYLVTPLGLALDCLQRLPA
ncbi:hypothetical protein [Amycolatopsis sp. cmx-4-68]|uniref:hypothetical protein n=1 Tax=Amycolatopsis sp. cmx-4-68 TaxID=2790938 RepID=UPI00397A14A6